MLKNELIEKSFMTQERRPGIEQCSKCGKEFSKKSVFKIIEHQVSVFRGEDIVYAFCMKCWGPWHDDYELTEVKKFIERKEG